MVKGKTETKTKKETKSKKEKEVVTSKEEKVTKNITIKKEKKSNIKVLTAVLVSIAITALCTWIFTGKYFDSSKLVDLKSQVGFFDLFNYPIVVLQFFGNIGFYILVIGGFYGVLHKIGAYRDLLDKMADDFKNHSTLFFIIVMSLLAIFTSVCGASFGLLIIVPFIISLILIMGYDKITAALVTVGSIAVGLIGTTLSSTYVTSAQGQIIGQNGIGAINTMLSSAGTSVDAYSLIITKIVILVLGLAILIYSTIKYSSKHQTKKLINDESYIPTVKNEGKHSWPIVVIIDLTLIIMLLSQISWTTVFKLDIFTKFSESFLSFSLLDIAVAAKMVIMILIIELIVFIIIRIIKKVRNKQQKMLPWLIVIAANVVLIIASFVLTKFTSLFNASFFKGINTFLSNLTIFKYPLFGTALGTDSITNFECWSFTELSTLLIIASIVLAIVYKVNYKELIKNFIEGAKRAIKPAVIVLLIFVVLVIVSYKPLVLTFTGSLVDKFNVFKMSFAALISSLFNVDLYYAANSTLPYAMSTIKDTTVYPLIALIWQTMYGLFTIVAPTSVILMAILSYLHVSYKDWLKETWKIIVGLFMLILLILTIVTIII